MNKNRFANLKKILCGVFIFVGGICLAGCVDIDKSYVAEKLLWQADQKVNAFLQQATTQNRQLKDSEVQEMIAAYRKVADRFPLERKAARAQFAIADIYIRIKKFEQAREELKRVIQNFSSEPEIAARAQFQIADIFVQEKKINEALQAYERVKDLYSLTPLGLQAPLRIMQFYSERSDEAGKERAYRQALRHYEHLVSQFSGTPSAGFYHNYIVLAHLGAKQWNRAIAVLDEIIAAYPKSEFAIRAVLSKAEVYLNNLDDAAKSIELYEGFLKEYPAHPLAKQARLRLGGLYLSNNEGEKAKQAFTSLLHDFPDEKELAIRSHFALASYYERWGNEQELLREYETIKKTYPDDPRRLSIPLLLYQHYRKAKNEQRAEDALQKAIVEYEAAFKQYKNNEQLSLTIAKSLFFFYAEGRHWNRLLDFLKMLEQQYPNNPNYPFSIANLYRNELRQPEEARRVYQEMLQRYAANGELAKTIQQQLNTLPQQ